MVYAPTANIRSTLMGTIFLKESQQTWVKGKDWDLLSDNWLAFLSRNMERRLQRESTRKLTEDHRVNLLREELRKRRGAEADQIERERRRKGMSTSLIKKRRTTKGVCQRNYTKRRKNLINFLRYPRTRKMIEKRTIPPQALETMSFQLLDKTLVRSPSSLFRRKRELIITRSLWRKESSRSMERRKSRNLPNDLKAMKIKVLLKKSTTTRFKMRKTRSLLQVRATIATSLNNNRLEIRGRWWRSSWRKRNSKLAF